MNYKFFLYGFLFGILLLCLTKKETKVFIQYPTPYNAGKIIYRDSLNNCYSFKSIRTKCSNDNLIVNPVN